MRLRKMRLAGFKSFIDQTTIEFPSDIIGIVGPNGCGKSNVIDAVRWVMGESSAKHLRGDMMADVIFNGSTSRKPVGQASVELIFDNSEGRLGDRFATYTEISVRRQVNRDGQSVYSLNGARCRRRDITDVFLGTGLGPRSYAIIEQGTISRLVEARPEELREFLEEAAGISKYKERRRETENRIRHTNENLERLDDLRTELDSQLERLRRQAAQAERFKQYKAEERRLRSEVLALRWSGLDERVKAEQESVRTQGNRVEAALAEQRSIEADLEHSRASQSDATEAFNEHYRQVLEAGAEVGRSEEAITNLRSQRDALNETLTHERAALAAAKTNAAEDAERLEGLRARLQTDQPELQRQEDLTAEARDAYERAERDMLGFQTEWEQLNQRLEEPTRTAHAEQARLQGIGEQRRSLDERHARLSREEAELADEAPRLRLEGLKAELGTVDAERLGAEANLARTQSAIAATRERESEVSGQLDDARQQAQSLAGKLASLEALQQAALDDGSEAISHWLGEQNLRDAPRLAEAVRVRSGYERALETVLGDALQAVLVPALGVHLESVGAITEGELVLIEGRESPAASAAGHGVGAGRRPLAEVLEAGPAALGGYLQGVYLCEGTPEALALAPQLDAGESVITCDGLWLGPDWVRIAAGSDAEQGVLAREQALRDVRQAHEQAGNVRDELATDLESIRVALQDEEQQRAAAQVALAGLQERYASLRSDVSAAQAEVDQRAQRARDVSSELVEVNVARETAERQAGEAAERLRQAEQTTRTLEAERERLGARRESLESGHAEARERWQSLRQGTYEHGLALESTRSQITALEEATARITTQVESLEARCGHLGAELDGFETPLQEAEAHRQSTLAQHAALEASLREARTALESGDARVRELEQSRLVKESAVHNEREALGKAQLAAQEATVRRETVLEQIQEQGDDVKAVLESIDPEATEAAWTEQLEQLDRRISRLGPINLAAIDEFEQQSERKTYLDAQHADLTEALETLSEAIRKIDQDTRARFKETYEKVNAGLEEKFPRLFGGGHAYLQLTSEDLLETGVAVMARPPGKRNSSIHLLSGGEKAMTAVALVFAIFDLNPAPFCLLDEVDAPLDDANVGRFAAIVREMSEQVQVLLVTHNKTTMESAQQLIGVTMNEPGVSRLVAVDLDSAVELAAD